MDGPKPRCWANETPTSVMQCMAVVDWEDELGLCQRHIDFLRDPDTVVSIGAE